MRKKLFLSTLVVPLFAIPGVNGALVLFDFRTTGGSGGVVDGNGNGPTGAMDTNFDPSRVGETITLGATGDPSLALTTTIVDILAPEYNDDFVRTGNILSAVNGDGDVTTNISGQDALGIGNPSISNNEFDAISASGNNGAESSDFNADESLIFTFDQDVTFTSIELESVVADDTFMVLVDGMVLLDTMGDDAFIDDLGALGTTVIAAGSEITFAAGGNDDVTSFRIETFEVDVVPEPSSLALLGLGGLMMFKRRRS